MSDVDDEYTPSDDWFEDWVKRAARERMKHWGYTPEQVAKAESHDALMSERSTHESLGCVYESNDYSWDCTIEGDGSNHPEHDAWDEACEEAAFMAELMETTRTPVVFQEAEARGSELALTALEARLAEIHKPIWDDSTPPGGTICAECRVPVESEPCATMRAVHEVRA